MELVIKDLETGKEITLPPMTAGISMTFNSKELEEAIAVFISTLLTQKTLLNALSRFFSAIPLLLLIPYVEVAA